MDEGSETKIEGVKQDTPDLGLELVTDGYYRHNDIVFSYLSKLSKPHADAMGSLIHGEALVHPNHPLRSPGDEGITLYIGIDKLGKPRLFWKIKQLQYLQYYIHEMRLTNPSWIEYHRKRQELLQEEANETRVNALSKPSVEEGKHDWVPLPSYAIRGSDLDSVIPITFDSATVLKKVANQITKDGKAVDRNIRNGYPVKPFHPNHWEAKKDDFTPGPGLRKGPEKQGRSDFANQNKNEGSEAAGWGGFPLSKNSVQLDGQDMEKGLTEPLAESEFPQNQSDPKPTLTTPDVSTVSPPSPSCTSPFSSDLGASYHYHCQQAFITAICGGLLASMPASQQPTSDEDEENTIMDIPPNIGRSLFIALCITKWEKDPKIVTEIGWCAVWWQKAVPDEEGSNGASSGYEEMRDMGHFVVQEHLIQKRNKDTQPDYKDDYLFGDSLPILEAKMGADIRRKIDELSAKAGNGPIYIITHSADGAEVDLKSVGLDISDTTINHQPDGWEVPPYMCASGCSAVFVINTATLFGSIENVSPMTIDGVRYAGRTKRSLQNIALTMFGNDPDRKPEKCGNAGNDAVYTLAIFIEVMTGATLPELRGDYANGQFPRSSTVTDGQDQPSSMRFGNPERPASDALLENDAGEAGQGVCDDEDDFLEDEMIKGIYYEDEDGNLIEMDD
ncbi:uncharacterized protein I206_101523 [Kwoniella pini CBS 10737]|uniref:Gfd2/YDR514C-like C-terminal domain-containing protein n=1 Tax=Kwoniella pini CBS 10737 TaxID=1296096 RepID=A0A1B9HWF3_9TREE|nr:uncharacterized protein I206_06504 [Kwoniella pini CBS 10737]OCF47601.1 hypothetical protein I206_06504 [Kwoniella pini CBS 10737]